MERWKCYGSIRGDCGVVHRSEQAAQAHCAEDGMHCVALGGGAYSDRVPVMSQGDHGACVCGAPLAYYAEEGDYGCSDRPYYAGHLSPDPDCR